VIEIATKTAPEVRTYPARPNYKLSTQSAAQVEWPAELVEQGFDFQMTNTPRLPLPMPHQKRAGTQATTCRIKKSMISQQLASGFLDGHITES
jgi:hypothetical protein